MRTDKLVELLFYSCFS